MTRGHHWRWVTTAALLSLSGGALEAQTSLPCSAWLATLAAGARTSEERLVLYDITRCGYASSVVLEAREAGMRSLLASGDAGGFTAYVAYAEAHHGGWVRDSLVAFALPALIDKSRPADFRGRLMFLLAAELRSRRVMNSAVFAPDPGQIPATRAFCAKSIDVSETSPTKLLQPAIDQIRVQAQTMIDDATEIPQLREAAHCLLYAAENPDRSL